MPPVWNSSTLLHQLTLMFYCAVPYHKSAFTTLLPKSPTTGSLNQIQPASPDFRVGAVHQIEEGLRSSGNESSVFNVLVAHCL